MLLNFNSQCDKILGLAKAFKTITMDKTKLTTHSLHNNTAKMVYKVHRDNVLLIFINERNTINKWDDTTKLVENEPRLEETNSKNTSQRSFNAIYLVQIDCRKQEKHELNQNRDLNDKNKNKSDEKRKRSNDNNNDGQFENISSEIIDNETSTLNALNDITFTLTEAVTRSKSIREKDGLIKKKVQLQ